MKTMRYRSCPLLLILVIVTMAIGAESPEQPVRYNHRLHTEDMGFGCLDCHQNADSHEKAMIPNIEMCGTCHIDKEAENSEVQKVAEYVSSNTLIPWQEIHKVPDFVYFTHRRHVTLGKIECQVCHGKVSEMETPFTSTAVDMDMAWCMECHEQQEVTNDCLSCHR